MHSRRRREPSTVSEWPRLSLLAIYRETPIFDEADQGVKLEDAAREAAKVLFLTSPGDESAIESTRVGRVMGTIIGVAAFARTLGPEGSGPIRAVHASRRRMLWYEMEPGYYVHATIALPRPPRHSRRPSATTTSSVASSSIASFTLDDDVLLAGLHQTYREYRLRYGTLVATLELQGKGQLKAQLAEYWQDWASRWDVTSVHRISSMEMVLNAVPRCSLLTPSSSPQLLPLLTQFAVSNPSVHAILLHGSSVLSVPDLNIARSSDPTERTSPPLLSDEDLLALVRYLHRLHLPQRSVSALPEAQEGPHQQSAPEQLGPAVPEDTATTSWAAPFSSLANGMTSFLAPRPMSFSLSSSPSTLAKSSPPVASSIDAAQSPPSQTNAQDRDMRTKTLRAGFAALRRSEKDALAPHRPKESEANQPLAEDAGGGWSFRKVSNGWSSRLGFGGPSVPSVKTSDDKAKLPADSAVPPGDGGLATRVGDEVTPVAETRSDLSNSVAPPLENATSTDHEAGKVLDGPPESPPATPAVELAPTVDIGELAAAMGASPVEERSAIRIYGPDAPHAESEVPSGSEETTDVQIQEREAKFELYCSGEHDDERQTKFHLRRYERGALTLGLAMLPKTDTAAVAWLDSRADRLLEAVESLLEVVNPPVPPFPQQHLVKTGLLVSSVKPVSTQTHHQASNGDDAMSADDELAISSSLLDAHRLLHTTPVLESLTRLATPAGPWVVHRRADAPLPLATDHTEVYAVLTSQGGMRGIGTVGRAKGKGRAGGEMSLVEAADEVRRLLSAYGRT